MRHETPDPVDAVMAHFFAVSFGLGKYTGVLRFGIYSVVPLPDPDDPDQWELRWRTGLRDHDSDTGTGRGKIVQTDHSSSPPEVH